MDNLGSHKSAAIRRCIEAADARLRFLPPYSPDLNPIEQAFAKIKHWMRIASTRVLEDTWRQVDATHPLSRSDPIIHGGWLRWSTSLNLLFGQDQTDPRCIDYEAVAHVMWFIAFSFPTQ
jgi:transposase